MNIFYNKEGVGDIFLISLQPVNQANFTYEKKDDVVKIVNSETGETAGFNLFNASNYVSFTVTKGLVDLTEELVAKLNEIINSHGFTDQLTADLSPKFVVGYVKEKEKHPQADKLSVCKVDVGTEILQIVCGAPNVDAGQKVVVAKIGAVMPIGLVIQPAELRGISSQGMICSARELALPNAPEKKGILVLEDTYTVGTEFKY
ncbi:YtpR family tRNA-binding protein [Caldifermentibacillus hisashii]|uniref:YtpR family tRNA-binding protein n=1 Tax=Caldifermentibacillus hisashii TaxID=996558 RepID=UPI0034D57952